MYPRAELNELAGRRATLHARIGADRASAQASAARAVRPLATFDRLYAQWRRISPALKLAALPMAIALKRTLFPRLPLWRPLLRWSPVVLGLVRRFARARV